MPTPPEYHIEGQVFVTTGAGHGIGRGIAEVLCEAGADGAITALVSHPAVAAAPATRPGAPGAVPGSGRPGCNSR